jgi:hypothetical protein
LVKGEQVAVKSVGQSMRERFEGLALVGMVVVVQVAWGAALIYLAVRFL